MSALGQKQTFCTAAKNSLFDHHVSALQKRLGDLQPERLGSLAFPTLISVKEAASALCIIKLYRRLQGISTPKFSRVQYKQNSRMHP
jgi:hypothetical protein